MNSFDCRVATRSLQSFISFTSPWPLHVECLRLCQNDDISRNAKTVGEQNRSYYGIPITCKPTYPVRLGLQRRHKQSTWQYIHPRTLTHCYCISHILLRSPSSHSSLEQPFQSNGSVSCQMSWLYHQFPINALTTVPRSCTCYCVGNLPRSRNRRVPTSYPSLLSRCTASGRLGNMSSSVLLAFLAFDTENYSKH